MSLSPWCIWRSSVQMKLNTASTSEQAGE